MRLMMLSFDFSPMCKSLNSFPLRSGKISRIDLLTQEGAIRSTWGQGMLIREGFTGEGDS